MLFLSQKNTAFSKASTIKYIKAVGTYSEAELAEAFDKTDAEDLQMLNQVMKQLHLTLQGVTTEKIAGKSAKSGKKIKPTSQEKFLAAIKKIEVAVNKYQASDQIDSWNVDFTAGEYYGNKTFSEIKNIHQKLMNVQASVEKIQLLVLVERGSMYHFLKNSHGRFGRWEDVCEELNVCRRTVDRYIDLFHIMNAYPRLLVCGLSFAAIMAIRQ